MCADKAQATAAQQKDGAALRGQVRCAHARKDFQSCPARTQPVSHDRQMCAGWPPLFPQSTTRDARCSPQRRCEDLHLRRPGHVQDTWYGLRKLVAEYLDGQTLRVLDEYRAHFCRLRAVLASPVDNHCERAASRPP